MIARRLGLGLLTLFIVSLIISLGVELLPGDLAEAILGQSATPETVAAMRRDLGLDKPLHTRYIDWLIGMLQGDMGVSLANGREISELIGGRLGNTVFLASIAAMVAVPLAVVLGILAALYRHSLGTYMILWLIEHGRSLSLPYVYLGYWIAESPKMSYKAAFRPLEAYSPAGWRLLGEDDLAAAAGP